MTDLIISGCCGTMGKVLSNCIEEKEDCRVVAGIDLRTDPALPYPVFKQPGDVDVDADVLIDFSNPALLTPLLGYGRKTKTPLVLCTTGYDKNQVAELEQASREVPIFYSRNMSIGVNLMIELCKTAARVLGGDFDIEVIEMHHNRKIDAPSGTALMLADAVGSEMEKAPQYIYDRHSQRRKRRRDEIGIHSIRGGTIVGEHEVIFAGQQELLTISHSAQSKEIFARGAVNAAVFLSSKVKGLYNMSDLLKQEVSLC